jgi:hypothetical protein
MTDAMLNCPTRLRRQKLFDNKEWNGIDYVEVASDQMSLCLHFFGSIPDGIGPGNIRIEGGRRITGIRAVNVEIERAHDDDVDDCLHVTLDKPGDFSTYRVCLVRKDGKPFDGFDPRYACAEFSFKLDCRSEIDCKVDSECPPETLAGPTINYLAKDYASFRQLIYDRLAVTMPDWRERHAPDLGVTLVEILAYAADHLSYYQDAVATEAYLETARLRKSIRRHLQLIDYHLHDGLNARALVTVWVSTDCSHVASDTYFITGFDGIQTNSTNIVSAEYLATLPFDTYEAFEPDRSNHPGQLEFYQNHNEIRIYTWGDEECFLPKGATQATLVNEGGEALKLKEGDILIFEEVLGPSTGSPSDADPTHRHAVRLTACIDRKDELLGVSVLEVEWGVEDALPFALCLSARRAAPYCDMLHDISVARGNVVVVTHGGRVVEDLGPVDPGITLADCACEGSVLEAVVVAKKFEPELRRAPLVFSEPVPNAGSVSQLFRRTPQLAVPEIRLLEYKRDVVWQPTSSLLNGDADTRHFVAECNEDGQATLRFGDGTHGRKPEAGSTFLATYRVGKPAAGNVGHDTINHIVFRDGAPGGVTIRPRNPRPVVGGIAPEPVEEARLIAPGLLKSRRQRAITAEDYAEIAARNAKLQGASADLRWTGSWRQACVAIDPLHSETPAPALLDEVSRDLSSFRRMGHDLSVGPARYVPLSLEIDICVLPHHARADVLRALIRAFSASATGGFFNADSLIFGAGVRLSAIVATAQRVEGVQTLRVTKLERLGTPDKTALDTGILSMTAQEIAQLDNDPDFPEHGNYKLNLRGGR